MLHRAVVLVSLTALAVAACGSNVEGQGMGTQASQVPNGKAAGSSSDVAALSLSEMQLLDADLVAVDGTDLGDIEQVNRGADGKVTGLVLELDSDPDRYVILSLNDLTVRRAGGDTDLQTTMTPQQLAALPATKLAR